MYKPTSDPEMETDNPTLRRRRDRLRASDQDRLLLTDQTERMLAIALAYRAAGYNVIPVARGKKHPYYEHEALQYIQLDEKTLTRVIMMTNGNVNLMAVCGYSSAGLFVVDFDDMRYAAYFEAQLRERDISITGVKSARGMHYHVQLIDGPVVSVGLQLDPSKDINAPGNHIGDLKAQGGLVVLPGSLHESSGAIYEALPGCLQDGIARVARIPYAAIAGIEFAPGRQLTLARSKRDLRPRALRMPDYVRASTPEGTRNELLFKSARWLRDNGFTADEALHVLTSQDCGAPAINCGLPIREIERTVESVYSRQTTAQVDADRATQHEAACYAYLRTRDVHPATAKVCARIYAQLRHIRDIARHRQDAPMLPTFPSQRKIAELAGVGNRNTVINGVTVLQKHELLIPSVEGSKLAYKTAYLLHNVERLVSVPDGTVASASDDALQNASPSQICQHNVPTVPEGDGGMRILVRHVEFRFTDAVKVLGTRGAAVNAIAKGRRNGYIRQTARGRYRIDRNRWAGYEVRQQLELLERKARKAHEYYIERQARIAALVIASFMSKADVVQELPAVAPDCPQARETAPTHAFPLPTPNRRRRKQIVA